MKKILFTNKHGNKFLVRDMGLEEAIEKYRPSIGLDERWTTEYLEGAESKEIVVQEYIPAWFATRPVYDENDNPTGEFEQYEVPEVLEVRQTLYKHPAEYTYEILDETLDEIKARKLEEVSGLSLSMNDELKKWNDYRAANILAGVYDEAKLEE